ncbi:MAG: hypothetical protein MUF18_16695 [Fimbriiglobus sp.]|nr:hypothetical protein [Fimbriiglobus sp.]
MLLLLLLGMMLLVTLYRMLLGRCRRCRRRQHRDIFRQAAICDSDQRRKISLGYVFMYTR